MPEEPASRSRRARNTSIISAIVLVFVLAVSVLLVVDSRGDGATDRTTVDAAATGTGAAGEVFLEPTNDLGPDPFTENVAAEVVVPATTLPAPPLTAPEDDQTAVLVALGTTPGLYGGTRDDARCDQDEMIAFLDANPAKAQAWADVMGIPVEELRSFISSLTPVQLRTDTRVTNHGFRDGVATPRQAVLQAGSAVLVDENGVPRARCACGNPLLEPAPVAAAPSYVGGDEWAAFDPDQLLAVQAGPPVDELILADLETDVPFVRPVGTDGSADVDAPPGTDLSDPLGAQLPETTPPAPETVAEPTTTDTATDGVIAGSLQGSVTFVDAISTELAALGTDYTQTVSDLDLSVTADGAATGRFEARFEVIDGDCRYESSITGDLAGAAVGPTVSGTWSGRATDSPIEGDCSGAVLGDEAVAGEWNATFDADGERAIGLITLQGRTLFDLEARR